MNVEDRVGDGVMSVGRRGRAGSSACVCRTVAPTATFAKAVTRLEEPVAASGLLGSDLQR
jgi:hypothetical protein